MTMDPGTRLGPYEIVAPIGAGGMGEVYRARDTRLDRAVAVKILPAELAQNAQFKIRFEREAKTISQLSHPNICTLFDVGDNYLVMELLDGQTLADRIAKGPLPLADVLKYGFQIAQALSTAHRADIVHRDLKPGNIMISRSGAKLLDFGLAKHSVGAAVLGRSAAGETPAPTERKPLTEEGTILGTFQYMAPEQLAGEEPDTRTDIFALGAVLYEMATGKRAFEGKTKTSLIGAIVSGEPKPISEIQPLTPPAFEHVVKKCLAKEADDRWQSAADIAEELRWISEAGSNAGVAAPIAQRRQLRARLSWLLNVALMLSAAALTWAIINARREPPRVVHAALLPPEKGQFILDGLDGPPALSPDGKRIAFLAAAEGKPMLWVRPLDSGTAQPLAGTEGAQYPFWSPDGRSIGFFAGGKLMRIDAAGGTAQVLCDTNPNVRGGTWSREGVIVFAGGVREGLSRISAAGGTPERITKLDGAAGEYTHRFPYFLPDGKHFLYMAQSFAAPLNQNKIYVGSLDGKERKFLVGSEGQALYSPAGYILFQREEGLMAQPFDASRLELTGEPRPVSEPVAYTAATGTGMFSASPDGTLAYATGSGGAAAQLVWLDRSGNQVGAVGDIGDITGVRLSHRGDRAVYIRADSHEHTSSLWLVDLQTKVSSRLTFGGGEKGGAVWSPDDSEVAYTDAAQRYHDILVKSADGTSAARSIYHSSSVKFVNDWSRDGRYIIYQQIDINRSSWDLWVLDVKNGKTAPFVQTPASETQGLFSPDGKWVAYISDETGAPEVFVQSFPPGRGKWQISSGGEPAWSADGKQLFFRTPVKAFVVDVQTTPSFRSSTPVELPSHIGLGFSTGTLAARKWDVSPDGKRFLVVQPLSEQSSPPITIVTNWPELLKK